jgi:alpha-1,2-glucosyltransferase
MPRVWILVIFTGISLAIVHYNTIIHPFTLADNRHYVFYVFRLLRCHWLVRYLAAPVYVLTGWLAIFSLKQNWLSFDLERKHDTSAKIKAERNGLFLVWLASSALSLITAPLVEPRYFILPWILWRLQAAVPLKNLEGTSGAARLKALDHSWLGFETVWYLAINGMTGYIFLNWTFEWDQEPGAKQRFMW